MEYLLSIPIIGKSETHKQVKLFTFLLDENILPDNIASERAIRNIKVKQKVSGEFKSLVTIIQGNSLF